MTSFEEKGKKEEKQEQYVRGYTNCIVFSLNFKNKNCKKSAFYAVY